MKHVMTVLLTMAASLAFAQQKQGSGHTPDPYYQPKPYEQLEKE